MASICGDDAKYGNFQSGEEYCPRTHFLEAVSLLVSEKLHEYTFPSQRAVSPGGGAFWTLKLIEPPQDDSGSTANKKKTRAKCKEIDLSPWSRLREIQDLYESSASRVVLSHTNASPYIENFWRDTPSGPQPEEQDLFVFTGSCAQGFSPVVISARKYDHMEGRIAVIWTPCGRDYFLIIGKCSSAVAARVALSLFFRLSQSPPSDGAKNPQHIPPIEKHQDIFDNIFKKIRVLDEKTRSIVDILFEAENSEIADTRGFNLSREKVKFLFDYGIFGIPVTPPIGDRSSSQILGYFDLDIGGVNSGSSPPGDHTQSFELYRTKLLKKTKIEELVNGEISYVNRQKRLVEYFYGPAMRYIEATDFVKLEYARRCMPSPWPIIEISAKLLESLGLSPDSPELEYDSPDLPSLKTVCNGLIEMFESSNPSTAVTYRGSILSYMISQHFFSEDGPKNSDFFYNCRKAYSDKYPGKIDVESLRIEPTQRAGKYIVILESIATALDPGHECFDLVCRAAYLARKFSEHLNSEDEISLNAKANISLCRKLGFTLPIFDLNSWYICEITVDLVSSVPGGPRVNTKTAHTIILFSSFLVIFKRNPPPWKIQPADLISSLCCLFNLHEIDILDCYDTEFIVWHSDDESFRFRANSKAEKAEFLKVLNRQTFLCKGQSRERVPYDAYYQEVDDQEVYYRVIENEALNFEAGANESCSAVGILLCSSLDDYTKNMDPGILRSYEVVSVVGVESPSRIYTLFASNKELVLPDNCSNIPNSHTPEPLNTKIDVNVAGVCAAVALGQFSSAIKTAVSNYVRLSELLVFDAEVTWRDKRLSTSIRSLVRVCGLMERKNSRAMSILTKKSRTSKISIMTFATNIKKRLSNAHARLSSSHNSTLPRAADLESEASIPPDTAAPCNTSPKIHPRSLFANSSSRFYLKGGRENRKIPRKDAIPSVEETSNGHVPDAPPSYPCDKMVNKLRSLIQLIEKDSNIREKGIYRIPGQMCSKMPSCSSPLRSSPVGNESEDTSDVHSHVSSLKSLLRDFFGHNPIAGDISELGFLDEDSQASHEEKIQMARTLLGAHLVEKDRKSEVLGIVMRHLSRVSENSEYNHMHSYKLANVLSPTLFGNLLRGYGDAARLALYLDFLISNAELMYPDCNHRPGIPPQQEDLAETDRHNNADQGESRRTITVRDVLRSSALPDVKISGPVSSLGSETNSAPTLDDKQPRGPSSSLRSSSNPGRTAANDVEYHGDQAHRPINDVAAPPLSENAPVKYLTHLAEILITDSTTSSYVTKNIFQENAPAEDLVHDNSAAIAGEHSTPCLRGLCTKASSTLDRSEGVSQNITLPEISSPHFTHATTSCDNIPVISIGCSPSLHKERASEKGGVSSEGYAVDTSSGYLDPGIPSGPKISSGSKNSKNLSSEGTTPQCIGVSECPSEHAVTNAAAPPEPAEVGASRDYIHDSCVCDSVAPQNASLTEDPGSEGFLYPNASPTEDPGSEGFLYPNASEAELREVNPPDISAAPIGSNTALPSSPPYTNYPANTVKDQAYLSYDSIRSFGGQRYLSAENGDIANSAVPGDRSAPNCIAVSSTSSDLAASRSNQVFSSYSINNFAGALNPESRLRRLDACEMGYGAADRSRLHCAPGISLGRSRSLRVPASDDNCSCIQCRRSILPVKKLWE